ncbi:dol-P-Man:Man(7)GlcNAc(2)-PP-Dol alpha-1,6-mannosyltransferase isoform X2 [Elaeis guineensis]|uniref:Mannosyltransferase n=1 Tax=Elaeis guineensis var. tenera TaxID=51953 RepID=A0A6I9RXN9_ELAGV|nr:dol-P-Man:Man(7)GlcNAc(2)-PP-Dol alpha-1,6-mannosyltransferase isoform X2 [Elaeis guineensis]
MAPTKPASNEKSSEFFRNYGWDVILGTIASFYVIMIPYTKVEESFNVQAMHDMLYHHHHINNYDHLDFPGVVPRTFMGALLASILASPVVFLMHCLHMPKIYSLFAVRLVLGCIILSTLRFFRIQVRRKFGYHVEAFFVILTAVQFHLLFYSTRPLPNILAFGLVNLAYSFWFKGNALATLKCLTFATIVFRCDTLLLFAPIGIELLLSKSISLWRAMKCCIATALLSICFTVLLDTVMWQRIVWPELEVFWFNSILNRSSEWGTHPFHWYFTSALPRSLLVAYPLCMAGMLLDRRILRYIVPVLSFVLLYSKLPHKELRFVISSVPVFNVSAAITASRIYINRKKNVWRELYVMMLGSLLISLGCSIMTFMASYDNYPGAYALRALHEKGASNCTVEKWVHIDAFTAMNGVSRFSENKYPWRYSKEEGIALEEYRFRNFTYLLNEHSYIDGFKCLFAVNGFYKARLQAGFPPIVLLKEPKVFVHGNARDQDIIVSAWPGCP